MLCCTSFIASGSSENLADVLLNFLTCVFGRFLGDLLKKFIFSFFSKSPRNLPKTRVKKLSKAYARFSEGPDAMNDVQYNITSLLLIFNKNVVFRKQMLFFHSDLDFYMDKCAETWKSKHLLLKNNIFVENQQQWCYVILHIIYSTRTLRKPSICLAQFFDSCFW